MTSGARYHRVATYSLNPTASSGLMTRARPKSPGPRAPEGRGQERLDGGGAHPPPFSPHAQMASEQSVLLLTRMFCRASRRAPVTKHGAGRAGGWRASPCLRLEVPMQDVGRVEVLEGAKQLVDPIARVGLGQNLVAAAERLDDPARRSRRR